MHTEAKFITFGELCEYLRVHPPILYRLLRSHQLPCFKIGSDWRFNIDEIDRWRVRQGAALDLISQDEAKNVH
jgi:excisionase family DNA binding protein